MSPSETLSVLLIDDNQDDRALAIRQLKRAYPLVEVTQVLDADQFEAALQSCHFDAVITDFQLGWTTGLEILRRLKSAHPDCPVIMFTASASQEQAIEAMKSGLDDYVVKSPRHYSRLPAALGSAITRNRAIAAHRQAEEALRRREEWIAATLECIGEGVITADVQCRVQSINPQAQQLTGWSASESIGRDIDEVLALTDPAGNALPESPARLAVREARSTVGDSADYCLVSRNGHSIAVMDGASPIYVGGKMEGIVIALRDISERKRMEGELLRSNEELQQFAYAASHDLQEPLRTVIVFTQLLAKRMAGQLSPENDRYMKFVEEAGKRMSAQIAGLMRYGALQRDAEVEVFPMDEAVQAAKKDLHAYIEERNARVECGHLESVRASRSHMNTIFQNLISNGLKYNQSQRPYIRIEMRDTPQGRLLAVTDDGIGIAPAHHEKVFSLFARLHPQAYSGTGIGLTSVRRAVNRLGGQIWIDPESNNGTTFLIKLPWANPVD